MIYEFVKKIYVYKAEYVDGRQIKSIRIFLELHWRVLAANCHRIINIGIAGTYIPNYADVLRKYKFLRCFLKREFILCYIFFGLCSSHPGAWQHLRISTHWRLLAFLLLTEPYNLLHLCLLRLQVYTCPEPSLL